MSELHNSTAEEANDQQHHPIIRKMSNPSSHHHVITPDILLDRLGLEELVPPQTNEMHTTPSIDSSSPYASHEMKILPALPERMNEESLDDCHAFTDITPNFNQHQNLHRDHDMHHSLSNVVPLEPLQETEEETDILLQVEDKHEVNEYYTAPLHLNVLRMSDVRLQGLVNSATSSGLHSLSSRSSSRSRTSRDVSPSPSGHHPVDPDILLDRLGLVELEPSSFHHHHHHHHQDTSSSSSNVMGMMNNNLSLPSLPERISEDTLDDCHAFTEFKLTGRPRVGSMSSLGDSGTTTPSTSGSSGNLVGLLTSLTRDGSVSGGSIIGDASLLETLEEFEEEEDEEEQEEVEGDSEEYDDVSQKIKKSKKRNGESNLDIIQE